MVSSIFREILLGRLTDMVVQKSVPMQRGARFAFSRSAPMQGGVRFVILKVPLAVPCWVKSGRQKRYKFNVFFPYFQNEGHAGSGHQMGPEEQNLQNMSGK